MKKIVIGTQNQNKFKEIKGMLVGIDAELLSLNDFPPIPEPEETGKTYRENAILKAEIFSEITKLPCVAEDSGLEVEFLNGEPGLYSRRWFGENSTAKERNQGILEKLQGVPLEKRNAKFICSLAMVYKGKNIFAYEGICHGRITLSPRGENGFGYDPIFEIVDLGKTFAEIGEEKHKISHRALAFFEFKKRFENIPFKM